MSEEESLSTEPPPPIPLDHGWLEQFEAFGHAAFEELKRVAGEGLQEAETELLITLSVKLIRLAHEHDSQALNKLLAEVNDLN